LEAQKRATKMEQSTDKANRFLDS